MVSSNKFKLQLFASPEEENIKVQTFIDNDDYKEIIDNNMLHDINTSE